MSRNTADQWIERYRSLWEESLERLDRYLRRLQKSEKFSRNGAERKEKKDGRRQQPDDGGR